jgi:UDP:flavonoid glycosyltransferase YjiC (YdhE family)
LRAEIGLPPTSEGNPLVGSHSPSLVLALFSELLAAKQPDWPSQARITGFPLFDEDGEADLSPELARFLEDGLAPIVFTLGMSAAVVAGDFYKHSVAAAHRLGRRAILVTGKNPRNLPASLPAGMLACGYAPFSKLFPRAAAIVHHGGIGTTGFAMRAGRPMLVVPFSHDNPDNAERLARLGVARTVPRAACSPGRRVGPTPGRPGILPAGRRHRGAGAQGGWNKCRLRCPGGDWRGVQESGCTK